MLSLATRFGSVALESGDCTGFVLVSRYVLRALSPITSSPTHYVCWPELAAARPDLGQAVRPLARHPRRASTRQRIGRTHS